MADDKDKPQPLARTLGGNESTCPVPNAHDKTNEAHYFLHQMMEHYHDCDRFRYSLSAYLQAARAVTLLLQAEVAHRKDFAMWYAPWQQKMKNNPDLQLLNSERVRVVHKETLVPASTMFFGAFEYGKEKFGFTPLPLDPMQDSVSALIQSRAMFDREKYPLVSPSRAFNCEEYGLTRTWSLPALKGGELTDFCTRTFASITEVVSAAHAWCGAMFEPTITCNHRSHEYRALRESMVCPEIEKAWEGPPTERVIPRAHELPLLLFPFENAKSLYTVTQKRIARGWVSNWRSSYWRDKYISMLVFSIGGRRLHSQNAVFFDYTQARIEPAKRP